MVKFDLFLIAFSLVAISMSCQSQVFQESDGNKLDLVLVGENIEMEYFSGIMISSYQASRAMFLFTVPLSSLEAKKDRLDSDNAFDYFEINRTKDLTIRIFLEDEPIDMGKVDFDRSELPVRVEFGEQFFETTGIMRSYLQENTLILNFDIENSFDPPISLGMDQPFEVKRIKLISDHAEILDFKNQLNK